MFDKLTGRLADVLNRLRGKGVVTADDVQESMREIRRALLEADVNFRVAKQFVDAVSEGAAGERVLRSLTPGQQIVGIVHEEMIKLLGDVPSPPDLGGRPPEVPEQPRTEEHAEDRGVDPGREAVGLDQPEVVEER